MAATENCLSRGREIRCIRGAGVCAWRFSFFRFLILYHEEYISNNSYTSTETQTYCLRAITFGAQSTIKHSVLVDALPHFIELVLQDTNLILVLDDGVLKVCKLRLSFGISLYFFYDSLTRLCLLSVSRHQDGIAWLEQESSNKMNIECPRKYIIQVVVRARWAKEPGQIKAVTNVASELNHSIGTVA